MNSGVNGGGAAAGDETTNGGVESVLVPASGGWDGPGELSSLIVVTGRGGTELRLLRVLRICN